MPTYFWVTFVMMQEQEVKYSSIKLIITGFGFTEFGLTRTREINLNGGNSKHPKSLKDAAL